MELLDLRTCRHGRRGLSDFYGPLFRVRRSRDGDCPGVGHRRGAHSPGLRRFGRRRELVQPRRAPRGARRTAPAVRGVHQGRGRAADAHPRRPPDRPLHHHGMQPGRLSCRGVRPAQSVAGPQTRRAEREVRKQFVPRRVFKHRQPTSPTLWPFSTVSPMQRISTRCGPWRSTSSPARPIRTSTRRGNSPTYSGRRRYGNNLDVWDGWVHDWPYWHDMIRKYL